MNMKTALAGVALAAMTAASAMPAAAQEITLKLSHFLPPVHGIHTDFIEPWAKDVEACTNGQVKIQIFPGGTQLGNVAKQQEQVLAGVVDIAHGLTGLPRGRFPRTSVIDIPFLTDDAGVATQTLWAMFPDYLAPEYKGLKVLALHAHNGGLIHTSEKKISDMEDMKGMRIRTPSPAVSAMLEQLGAIPQGMPPGQVYEGLQKGVIDGTVFPWDPVNSFKLSEVLKYHLDAGVYTVSFFFVMNQAKYDALPENVRGCIDQYSGDGLVARFGDWWDAWDAPGLAAAKAKGNEITVLSDEERARWREALAPMIASYLETLKGEGVEDPQALYKAAQDYVAQFSK
ncbi:TRAP transporter substrate-binding protein [Stappia sp.]|jgi:TRAP-type C4-dicarboxylate transport system substrate-binding protein|uniref:TRAP transporter substrate-binding protein n=1 Tax=Stappia sp. TaxID=1870903 RepID=UPI003A98D6FC